MLTIPSHANSARALDLSLPNMRLHVDCDEALPDVIHDGVSGIPTQNSGLRVPACDREPVLVSFMDPLIVPGSERRLRNAGVLPRLFAESS
jgi:hypothetical protein